MCPEYGRKIWCVEEHAFVLYIIIPCAPTWITLYSISRQGLKLKLTKHYFIQHKARAQACKTLFYTTHKRKAQAYKTSYTQRQKLDTKEKMMKHFFLCCSATLFSSLFKAPAFAFHNQTTHKALSLPCLSYDIEDWLIFLHL